MFLVSTNNNKRVITMLGTSKKYLEGPTYYMLFMIPNVLYSMIRMIRLDLVDGLTHNPLFKVE